MNNTLNAGIDIGYYSTKIVADGGVSVILPSVTGTPDMPITKFYDGKSDDHLVVEVLEEKIKQYLVGNSALRLSRITQRREDRTWIENYEYYVLLIAALAIAAQSQREALINVTTGLPVSYYDADKPILENIFGRIHRAKVNGTKLEYEVNARVTTQGFGSYIDLLMGDDGLMHREEFLTSIIGIVDIGGHTTNIQTIDRTENVRPKTATFPIGGWDLVRSVQSQIANEYPDVNLQDHSVAEAIKNRAFKRYGKPESIAGIVDVCSAPIVRDVLARLTQLWGSGSGVDAVYVTGGGAHLFGSKIVEAFPHAELVQDPVMSNARGYWKYTRIWTE